MTKRSWVVTALPVLLALLVACGEPSDDASVVTAAPPPALGAEPPEPEIRIERTVLGRGGSLLSALADLDLPPDLRQPLLEAFEPHIDSRRLPAATGLSVVWDAAGSISGVACRPAFEHYVRVTVRGDGTLHAEKVEVPVRTTVETAGGIVESSVAVALAGYRDSGALTMMFADIFQWDVDLFVDPRSGDRVRLVYTVRSLGRADPDLPPFGRSGMEPASRLGVDRILAASYDGAMASSTAFWVDLDGHGGNYYDRDGEPLRKAFLKSPLNYRRISSHFTHRRRHPITRKVVPHHGVDFAADSGTPVVATAEGRVISAGWDGALGKAVRIRHGNGYKTVYGHLRGFARGTRRGAHVEQNQVIGYVGSTGRATGPHLHYTMLANDRAINPMTFKNPPVEPLAESFRPYLVRSRLTWAPLLLAIRPGGAEVGIARVPRDRLGVVAARRDDGELVPRQDAPVGVASLH